MMRTHPQPRESSGTARIVIYCAFLMAVLGLMAYLRGIADVERLVVYCAHDAIFAEDILRSFERETGIRVAVKYDTEATKSLGLTELILAERDRPRCDVFWNNEPLGTMDLAQAGVLEPYQGTGFAGIPAGFKDPNGHWTGFAARFRVWIVNTNAMPGTSEAISERVKGDLSRAAIAKPLYGTTRVHYTVLWATMGADALKAWHDDCRRRGIKEVNGNAMSRNLVADGLCDFGLTDTDDFFGALDRERPVVQVPATVEGDRTICIPNTVAIVRGTQRLDNAKKLVDYLLSAEVEMLLALSPSRQVPLGDMADEAVPEQVRTMQSWVARAYPIADIGPARGECLQWLKTEYGMAAASPR